MLGVLPRGHDISTPTPMPLWRDFTVDKVEVVTYGLIGRGAAAITERLLADVGVDCARWTQLLDRFADLVPNQEAGLATLESAEPKFSDCADREELWKRLRQLLHHHRQFPDAEWSMPAEVLDRLQAIYDRFAPVDSLERIAWLFEQSVTLPNPSKDGWRGEQRDLDAVRVKTATTLYAERGAEGVLALARLAGAAGYLGKALYDGGLRGGDLDALVGVALQSDNLRERDLAHGLIVSAFRDLKEPWGEALLARAKAGNWGDSVLLAILRAFPVGRWTWDRAAQAGDELETAYWRDAPVFWMGDESDHVAFAIRKLISVGRARHALALVEHSNKESKLKSDLLVELLREAAQQPLTQGGDANEATMFQHYVAEIFQILDDRDDVDDETLVSLEWIYLPVLTHSRRPAKALLKALSEQPALFVEMLKAVFKPSEESGISDPKPKDPEHARAVAEQAYRLLELWNRVPGTRDDGTIDGEALEAWIKEARLLAKEAGRADIADSQIGKMLSASAIGVDGNWPAEAVREAIDLFRSRSMIEGFWIGKSNRRGVTTRGPRDGGDLERREAAKYRNWAKAISFEHPHTAKALDSLAESYEHEAKRHDESAERLDWK